jgi:hypothetical protein
MNIGEHLNKNRDALIKPGWAISHSKNNKKYLFYFIETSSNLHLYYQKIINNDIYTAKKSIEQDIQLGNGDSHNLGDDLRYENIQENSYENFYRCTWLKDILKNL